MQYEQETFSVQARMCSRSEAHLSTSEDEQYESGTLSSEDLQYKRVDHQALVQGGTTQKYFPMNESLLLLTLYWNISSKKS